MCQIRTIFVRRFPFIGNILAVISVELDLLTVFDREDRRLVIMTFAARDAAEALTAFAATGS